MAHSNGSTPTWPRTRTATARAIGPAWRSPMLWWRRFSSSI